MIAEAINYILLGALTTAVLAEKYAPQLIFSAFVLAFVGTACWKLSRRM